MARRIMKNNADSNQYTALLWTANGAIASATSFALNDFFFGITQGAASLATATYTYAAFRREGEKALKIDRAEKICTGLVATALSLYAAAKIDLITGPIGQILNKSSLALSTAAGLVGAYPLLSKNFFRPKELNEVHRFAWKDSIIPALLPWGCFFIARVSAFQATDGLSSATQAAALINLALTVLYCAGQIRSASIVKSKS